MIEPYLVELRLAREPGLDVAMRYPLAGGGKRIRPRLCLAAARAVRHCERMAVVIGRAKSSYDISSSGVPWTSP